MTPSLEELGIDKLTPEEKMDLAEAIWDSIDPAAKDMPRLTDAQRLELRRRAAEADADPDGGEPWEQVKAEILKELRSQ
jgi:putative addiction module component (TIGR02574 family)